MGRGTGEAEGGEGSGLATGAEQEELTVLELTVLNGQSTTKFISIVVYKTQAATESNNRAQEYCESRGERPGLPSLLNLRFLWT